MMPGRYDELKHVERVEIAEPWAQRLIHVCSMAAMANAPCVLEKAGITIEEDWIILP